MKKILISNNKLLQPLYSNLDETVYEKKVMSELKCIDEIKKNNFDLALIYPLVYTSVITKVDLSSDKPVLTRLADIPLTE